jgi:hypothetical protein
MNPQQAKFIIEKLIEEHGPDCAGTNHQIVLKAHGQPAIIHKAEFDAKFDTLVCCLGKAGMKRGFTVELWNEMGDLLSKAVNDI